MKLANFKKAMKIEYAKRLDREPNACFADQYRILQESSQAVIDAFIKAGEYRAATNGILCSDGEIALVSQGEFRGINAIINDFSVLLEKRNEIEPLHELWERVIKQRFKVYKTRIRIRNQRPLTSSEQSTDPKRFLLTALIAYREALERLNINDKRARSLQITIQKLECEI